MSSYSPSIVTMALSVSFTGYSDLLVENREMFMLHLYLAPRRGWRCRNFVKMFDADKTRMIALPYGETSSSAVAKRPHDASCLSVVSFIASLVQYLERSFFWLITSSSDLLVRTTLFCFVVFGVMSSLAVIHRIHSRWWLCIVRDRARSVSHCGLSRVALGGPISVYPH